MVLVSVAGQYCHWTLQADGCPEEILEKRLSRNLQRLSSLKSDARRRWRWHLRLAVDVVGVGKRKYGRSEFERSWRGDSNLGFGLDDKTAYAPSP